MLKLEVLRAIKQNKELIVLQKLSLIFVLQKLEMVSKFCLLPYLEKIMQSFFFRCEWLFLMLL